MEPFIVIKIYFFQSILPFSMYKHNCTPHNYSYYLNMIDSYLGWTSLMYAAYHQNNEVVKWLLEHGAEVTAQDVYGELYET